MGGGMKPKKAAQKRGAAAKMPLGKRFQKGQPSANPGGRPKAVVEVVQYARKHTLTAMNALIRIVKSSESDQRAVVAAAKVLIDRGWGQAPQKIELGGEVKINSWIDFVRGALAEEKAEKAREEALEANQDKH